MAQDIVLYLPDAERILATRKFMDTTSVTLSEIVTELAPGDFVLLEGPPDRRYMAIKRTAPLDFIATFRDALFAARRGDASQITGLNQEYDLQITCRANRCAVRDLYDDTSPTLQFDFSALSKSLDKCAANVFELAIMLFPEISSRKDIDELRELVNPRRGRRHG